MNCWSGEKRTRMAAARRADVRAPHFAAAGSQKWLQVAIERRPKTLLSALRRCGAVERASSVEWRSPLREQEFKEYRDHAALTLAGVQPLRRPLADFWPARGPVWDAIGVRSREGALFLEAKAHIPETASPPSRASTASAALISRSLAEARRWYSPGASAPWDRLFYQYANRLAHHFFLRRVNRIDAALVFLYFVNADDVRGPKSELEWRGCRSPDSRSPRTS